MTSLVREWGFPDCTQPDGTTVTYAFMPKLIRGDIQQPENAQNAVQAEKMKKRDALAAQVLRASKARRVKETTALLQSWRQQSLDLAFPAETKELIQAVGHQLPEVQRRFECFPTAGLIIAKLGKGRYQVDLQPKELRDHPHGVLLTSKAFTSAGLFTACVTRAGTQRVRLNNGFMGDVEVIREE